MSKPSQEALDLAQQIGAALLGHQIITLVNEYACETCGPLGNYFRAEEHQAKQAAALIDAALAKAKAAALDDGIRAR